MAVKWANNSLRLASANDGVTPAFTCESITVYPSAGAWVAVIKSADGVDTLFEQLGADATGGTFNVKGTVFRGAVLTTATNLTSVVFNGTRHVYNDAIS